MIRRSLQHSMGWRTICLKPRTRTGRYIAHHQQVLVALVHTISHRVAEFLEREGIMERDEENSYLNLEEGDEDLRKVKARTPLSLHHQASGIGETAVTDAVGEYPVSAQNALQ